MMKLPLNVDFTGKVVVVTGAGGVRVRRDGTGVCAGGRESRGAGLE